MKAHIERMVQAMLWADPRVIAALADCPAAQEEALPLLSHLLAAENAAGYAAYLERLSEADLADIVLYKTTKGLACATPAIDILTHLVIHGAYHRGQIAKALGRAGKPATDTDYITFVRSLENHGGY